MPLVIGVTGSIATGKSSVCETLVSLGAVHCNADTLVHQLYAPNTPGFDRVVAEFGEDVIAADGTIDRKMLGNKVFGNPDAMRRLTRAMGDISGLIKQTIDDWRATLPADGVGVMEAVNMIEPGYSAWLDQTWLIASEPDAARPRLMTRNGFSEDEANQRLNSQRDWRLRAPAADFVLHNDGTREEMVEAVRAEFTRIVELARRGELPPSKYHAWRAENPMPQVASAAAEKPGT